MNKIVNTWIVVSTRLKVRKPQEEMAALCWCEKSMSVGVPDASA